jgi:phospholipase C
MQMNVLITAAILVTIISLAMLQMANADSFLSSPPVQQPHSMQDAMNTTITDGLQLANQSSRLCQEKLHHNQSDQPLTANGLNGHNNKFDNQSPSVLAGLPF